jgi:hypothetical protein
MLDRAKRQGAIFKTRIRFFLILFPHKDYFYHRNLKILFFMTFIVCLKAR